MHTVEGQGVVDQQLPVGEIQGRYGYATVVAKLPAQAGIDVGVPRGDDRRGVGVEAPSKSSTPPASRREGGRLKEAGARTSRAGVQAEGALRAADRYSSRTMTGRGGSCAAGGACEARAAGAVTAAAAAPGLASAELAVIGARMRDSVDRNARIPRELDDG
jgi:hypothetical protein